MALDPEQIRVIVAKGGPAESLELGRVTELPAPLQKLDSESLARVLELEIDGKGRFIVARANVELIEEA